MPCKSLRFVVSPLTVPVEHDRRRCIGRNTIISAVNKFLHGVSLSTKSSCPTDFQLSLPGRVPNPCRDILESPRQEDTITGDLCRSIAAKKRCMRVYVLLIDYNFSAPTIRSSTTSLPFLPFFYSPRFDQGFINFVLNRILNKNRFDYSAREKVIA